MLNKIKNLPKSPGVYQYFNKNGKLLYVGKAKDLSNRVKSYFSFTPTLSPSPRLSARIHKMISEAYSMDYIVVSNEHDALILENSLIKQLKPKYNILLRDDKTYPYIYIDLKKTFPRFEITRNVIKGKNIKYFGPFTTASREILESLYQLFPLVQKKGSLKNKKACLFYQIGRCLAPCEGKISEEEYHKIITKALEALKNKNILISLLKKKMNFYAQKELFEEAGKTRDTLKKIEQSTIFSQVDLKNNENYDVFALETEDTKAVMIKLFVRNGKIVSLNHTILKNDFGFSKNEIYKNTLINFYKKNMPLIAKTILLKDDFKERKEVELFLSQRLKMKITLQVPQKGPKKELVILAEKNAIESLKKVQIKYENILKQVKSILKLNNTPWTIEAYDNSHMQGSNPVGSCIYWENGFQKNRYRHYILKSHDEYAQMRETLVKRCESFEKNPPPDLWVIDGGKTLLNLAYDITKSFGVDLDIIAISKEKNGVKSIRAKGKANDKIWTINGFVPLSNHNKILQFIQMLRDEAHRFVINFHRKQKIKQDKQIELLNKKGIGVAKVKKLITYFGSFEKIYSASEEELANVLNKTDAKNIKQE